MSILDFFPLLFLIGVIYFFWKQNQSTRAINNGGNPALVKCKDCGQAVSKNAKACPHCGATRKKTSWVAWCVAAFMLLVMFNIISGVSHTTPTPAIPTGAPIPTVYNPVAKWGAEKVAAANKVMDMVKHDCNVFEDNGDLVVEMRNYMDDRNALLKYVRAIADTDVILHGAARNIYYYDPAGKKIAKADTTYGVRLEN